MNDNNTQTNLVVEINECFGVIVWWGTTHEKMEQHPNCPIAMRCVFCLVFDALADRVDVTSDNVSNDFLRMSPGKAAMLGDMSSQLVDVLR